MGKTKYQDMTSTTSGETVDVSSYAQSYTYQRPVSVESDMTTNDFKVKYELSHMVVDVSTPESRRQDVLVKANARLRKLRNI